jgi:hypothetical protein
MSKNKKSIVPFIVYSTCLGVVGTGGGLIYFSTTIKDFINQSTEITKQIFNLVPKDIFSLKDFNFSFRNHFSDQIINITSLEQLSKYTNYTGTSYRAEFLKYIEKYFDGHPDLQNPEITKLVDLIKENSKLVDKASNIKHQVVSHNFAQVFGVVLIAVGLLCALGYTIHRCCTSKKNEVPISPIPTLAAMKPPTTNQNLYPDAFHNHHNHS